MPTNKTDIIDLAGKHENTTIEFNKWPSGEEYLMIKTKSLRQNIEYINKHNIRHLGINSHFGFTRNDLDFLAQVPSVTHLSIETSVSNVEGAYALKKCKTLWIADTLKHAMDFSKMPSLRNLGFYWNKHIYNLKKCTFLDALNIIGYSFKDDSLEALIQLKTLTVNQPKNLDGLSFLKSYIKLEELHLFTCRNLADISDLKKVGKSLKLLEFNRCPAISNWSVLQYLKEMNRLIITKSAPLPSLKWVKIMPKLEMLSFVDSDIEDGDLSYCDGLAYVGFTNKKKYNRTFEQLNPSWGK